MGSFVAERAKNQGFGWQQGCVCGGGGGALAKAEKMGKMGENGKKWGEMGGWGENFCDFMWKNGENMV